MIALTQLPILNHNCGVNRKQILNEQGEGNINTQYTKVTAHYVAKKVMEPKDKNYIKEIIDEMKSSEFSEQQATSKATIGSEPCWKRKHKEITNNQVRQEATEKNYKVNSRNFMY